jgi:predicted transcriptional regulator
MRKALSELEHFVMDFVWSHGPATAEDIRLGLEKEKELTDSTIRTILRRLEEKGYLRHSVEGRAFLYQGVEAPKNVAASAVRGIIDRFCGGSVEELLVGMVEGEVLNPDELKQLAAKIAAKKSRKKD